MPELNRKTILAIVPRVPYPLNSGGRIAIFETLKALSEKYKLVVVIIDDKKENQLYVPEIEKLAQEVYFFYKKKSSILLSIIAGVFRGMPLQVSYFYFQDVQKRINELADRADLILPFMVRTTSYATNIPAKKMHYAIDSMYLNYKKSRDKSTSLFWKLLYQIEIPLLFKMERYQIEKFDVTTFVNHEEASFWKDYGRVEPLPHGIEDSVFDLHLQKNQRLGNVVAFIGRMDYQPNIDAVLWFCKNVLQHLSPELKFWIIGGYPTPAILDLQKQYQNVEVKGFVEDVNDILHSCVCTVAPMQSGGGLQTKILLAMALKGLVITTSMSAQAIIGAENGNNIFIEDNPYIFADRINQVYLDPIKYEDVKEKGRKLVKDNYSVNIVKQKLFSLISGII